LYCGSLMGEIRNSLGLFGLSYLVVDDEALMNEIIDTFANLYYQIVEYSLAYGAKFDFGHFWEDICYKSGPLVSPAFFRKKVGPHYHRICDLLHQYGIEIVSLDCDGKIDALIPTWLENGVNTMFPIEVGTWGGNIKPWREKYGRQIRGVGGMDKKVFAYDYIAIDNEIERLKSLVDLGGFIPCPDHRIAPDAKWENVQYYCERMRKVFG
jgi:uroporphyrinogen decarboxylase